MESTAADPATRLALAQQAAHAVLTAHEVGWDRCEVLQNGATVVLRLSETLVARVVPDGSGARSGNAWFARETAMARHLTACQAPVIPLHAGLPQVPHRAHGCTLNFWEYVQSVPAEPVLAEAGRRLALCHQALQTHRQTLPHLAILHEALALLPEVAAAGHFPQATVRLLQDRLAENTALLESAPRQPLHGDAHLGNALNTTQGLLWTDWEDAFSGPVEWDVSSAVWNARLLEGDAASADALQAAYEATASHPLDSKLLHQCHIARAAVMCIWYPVLYPNASPERQHRLQWRLRWLENC